MIMYYAKPHERPKAQQLADDKQCNVRGVDGADGPTVFYCRPRYRTIADIKLRNQRNGGKWFDPSNMRFFSCRVQLDIYLNKKGEAFFVSSERRPGDRRLYSVRVARRDGSIDTVGKFQGYETGRAAHAAARRAALEA